MNDNDKKLREMLTEEPVPQELEPESVRKMLDEKAPAKKRNKIHRNMALRITAGAAACAVVATTVVHFAGQRNVLERKSTINSEYEKTTDPVLSGIVPGKDDSGEKLKLKMQAPYMSGASGYSEVYKLFKDSTKEYSDMDKGLYMTAESAADAYVDGEEAPANGFDEAPETPTEAMKNESIAGVGDGDEIVPSEQNDYSETYNQEEGVLEADVVKTDGKFIYYVYNQYNYSDIEDESYSYITGHTAVMNVAAVDNGTFTSSEKIDLSIDAESYFGGDFDSSYCNVRDMYVYNDMLLVVGNISAEKWIYFDEEGNKLDGENTDAYGYADCLNKEAVFVSVYTTGESPQLLDTYFQEGSYEDVRISADGYMYLISDYFTQSSYVVKNENELENYVPTCGINDDASYIAAEDILLPTETNSVGDRFSYTVIGSLDLNVSGEIAEVDSKALAGYTGQIYCSQDNLYTSSHIFNWDDTEEDIKVEKTGITRIEINAGTITPAASATIDGTVKDQFSMSEYNGFFRVAANRSYIERVFIPYDNFTVNEDGEVVDSDGYFIPGSWENDEFGWYSYNTVKINNCVYVLDMDMNIVGESEAFGENETIKSASFSGDIAYVVTYEQTDPLFAINLSEPSAPEIMDEFKIPGYSTYMQKWNDGQLLGFGISANEEGFEQGVKLTMFDNSDPYNLQSLDTYEFIGGGDSYVSSDAVWDRKALLIAPEKNLIGFPLYHCEYDWDSLSEYRFVFFSFEDGKFVYRGEVSNYGDSYNNIFQRAVYIGDYVYVISGNSFTAMKIASLETTDEVLFN